jgi:hypothetical protein
VPTVVELDKLSVMRATDIVTIGNPMPLIAGIRHAHEHFVSVTWADGLRKGMTENVDLAPVIMQYRIFQPLRVDVELFASVQLSEDGDTLVWDEGRIDMAATTVERLAAESMTNAQFRSFLDRHGLTLDAAGAVLGISRRQVAYYSKDRPIPRLVALACAGYAAWQAEKAA